MIKVHFNGKTENIPLTDNGVTDIFSAITKIYGAAVHSPCGWRGTCKKCRAALYDPDSLILVHDAAALTAAVTADGDTAAKLSQKYNIPAETAPYCREVLICRLEKNFLEKNSENHSAKTTPELFLQNHEQISEFAQSASGTVTADNAVISVISAELDTPTRDKPISVAENIEKHTGIPCRNKVIIEKTAEYLNSGKNALYFYIISDESSGTTANVIANVTDTPSPAYTAAVDIGTTTISVSILRIGTDNKAEKTAESVCENPQRQYGADVISRMSYAEEAPENIKTLQTAINARIASLISDISEQNNIPQSQILYVSIAGNSVMEHMYTGMTTKTIARSPFYMETGFGYTITPDEAGLNGAMNPCGKVYLPPIIASYVGRDISIGAAYLLNKLKSEEKDIAKSNILFMDLGTNGEIGLFSNGVYRFAATAAGPCLEGANIEMGMCASRGAVCRVKLTSDPNSAGAEISAETIGKTTPVGICGSGIIDAVAVLLDCGLVDEYGGLADEDDDTIPETLLSRLCETEDGKPAVSITPEVMITAADIRQVQTAKAAISAGVKILLKQSGLAEEDIDEIYLAGSFGGGINPVSAQRIGLLPKTDGVTPISCGNTSASGAAEYMLSGAMRSELADVMSKSVYTELSADPEFNSIFIDSMLFDEQ